MFLSGERRRARYHGPPMRRRTMRLASAVVLLLAACTGAPTTSETPTAAPSPSPVGLGHPVYAAGNPGAIVLWEAQRQGESSRLAALPENLRALALSPNGRSLAMVLSGPSDRLVLWDMAGGGGERVLVETRAGEHLGTDLQWKPDGTAVAASTTPPETAPGAPSAAARLLLLPVDGSSPRELLGSATDAFFVTGWSADGGLLFFGRARYRTDDPGSLWSIKVDSGQLRDLLAPRAFSDVVPDGNAVVYAPFQIGSGLRPELWEAVLGQDRRRIAQLPGLSDLRVMPSGQSVLVVLTSQDGKTIRFARVARDTGAVTPLGASFTSQSPVFARFAVGRVIVPSGDTAVVTLDEQGRQSQSLLWVDLAHDRVRLLATAQMVFPAGWR